MTDTAAVAEHIAADPTPIIIGGKETVCLMGEVREVDGSSATEVIISGHPPETGTQAGLKDRQWTVIATATFQGGASVELIAED